MDISTEQRLNTQPSPGMQWTLPQNLDVSLTNISRVTISFPVDNRRPDYLAVFCSDGALMYSKYNPATHTIDATVHESGVYIVRSNEISFSDIERKHEIMQDAILQLASKGIMSGTADGLFLPDNMITRAEFVTALIWMFDLLDISARSTFDDVSSADWFYAAAASAQQGGVISGFNDNTFRGDLDMPKNQMIVATSNTLVTQMGYSIPRDVEQLLERYIDRSELAAWSLDGIALATRSNILIYREDSRFAPAYPMTRGDASIILNKVFDKIW